jgi:eukaryotic-like serine/threonine-protein kinase
MSLQIGQQLGSYEITSLLGKGGMGEVYRARDTKLKREVAVKVLPDEFTRDPERIARFQREAEVLASLNHTNIAVIHDVQEANGSRFLIMELVEGETLADRIARGPITLEEALAIAKQICQALQAAHEKGIVHRDLKPSNVKILPDEKVKVLDFGLAKAIENTSNNPTLTNSPTLSMAATGGGMILGTAAYMSPEQARGRRADQRSDIWALGCVLFEMVTGRQAFTGEDIADILSGVMRTDPDWSLLPASTPDSIRILLRRCLEKNPVRRYHAAADVLIQLEDIQAFAPVKDSSKGTAVPQRVGWRKALAWCAAAMTACLITGVAVWQLRPALPRPLVTRAVIPVAAETALDPGALGMLALSPDGKQLAYVGTGRTPQLYLRAVDSGETRALPGTQGASTPFFSPDGQWIGFATNGKIKKVSFTGGAVFDICDAALARGIAWGPNDTIVFSPLFGTSLFKASAAGGETQELTKLQPGETYHRWPQFLPDGNTILFAIGTGSSSDDASIAAQRLDTGERKILIRGGTFPRFMPTGHLVYYRAGTIMAVPFDERTLEVKGTPVPVLEGVLDSVADNGGGQFSVSQTGTLVYVAGAPQGIQKSSLVWVDRRGIAQPLPAPERNYANPWLSPDGREVALNAIDGGRQDIWVYNLTRDTLTRLSFEGTGNSYPSWTPDGKRIVYRSQRSGQPNLFWKPADGSGAEERLTSSENMQTPVSVSPDGRTLVYAELNLKTGYDLMAIPLDGERKPRIILQTPFDDRTAQFSPDGRWLAYISNESGRYEVYVQPFPGPGGKQQISTDGGAEILWGKNGELFYRVGANREKMMAVDFETNPTLRAGKPKLLFEGLYASNATNGAFRANYSVSADGQRFLMIKPIDQPQSRQLTQIDVVVNWLEELKQRVTVK